MSNHRARAATATLVVCAAVLTGCAVADETPTTVSRAPAGPSSDVGAVNAAVTLVAQRRAAFESSVASLGEGTLAVGTVLQGLSSAATVDTSLAAVPGLAAAVRSPTPDEVAADLAALVAALDRAEAAVAGARGEVTGGSWEARFLEAQQAVLDALRAWAGAGGAVVEGTTAGRDEVTDAVGAAVAFVDQRYRYRSEAEAAGTWEVEHGEATRRALAVVGSVAPLVEAQADAAVAVGRAQAEAEAVFAERPSA